MANLSDHEINELKQLLAGGHVNTIGAPSIGGYNPDYEIERTTSAPYQIIVHERVNYDNPSKENVHLITVIDLDGLDGKATRIYPQVRSTDP